MDPEDRFAAERAADQRMAWASEWDDLVGQVRRRPGGEDFLASPPVGDLLADDPGHTIAIVNVSTWRCDALLVRKTGVQPLELRGLTADDARSRTTEYLRVLREAETAADEVAATRERARTGGSAADRQALQRALRLMR